MDLAIRNEMAVEELNPSVAVRKALGNFAVPLSLWAVALLLAGHAMLPDHLSGLIVHGPYLLLASGLLLSLAFRRGRAFFVLVTLALAYFAFVFFTDRVAADPRFRIVYAAICVFVPFNIAIFSLLRERGVLSAPGLRRLSLPLIEVGASVAMVLTDVSEVSDLFYQPIMAHVPLEGIQIPQWGVACTIGAVVTATICAVLRGSVVDAAFAAAASSFALACNDLASLSMFHWFSTVAGVMVVAAVVQDSYRLAFFDELTGLPGRRALSERLGSLDRGFTLAMVDIDHFKAFNDTWGHDVGDQVLKLVAARLQRVGGGGTAYRYGGEEFAIIFPGRRATSVMQHLESLRKNIESYKLMIRERGRPPQPKWDNAMLIASGANRWISVTISAGVAQRADRLDPPETVLAAADKALYRAKTTGRNRVSR